MFHFGKSVGNKRYREPVHVRLRRAFDHFTEVEGFLTVELLSSTRHGQTPQTFSRTQLSALRGYSKSCT